MSSNGRGETGTGEVASANGMTAASEAASVWRKNRARTYLRMNSVDIFVRDLPSSLRFYRETLGFQIAFDAELQSGKRWVAVTPPDGTAMLTLIQPEPSSPAFSQIGRHTGVVLVTDDLTRQYDEWRERGVRFNHTPRLRRIKYQNRESAVWGEVYTRFDDIDGNRFTLLSLDEVSQAIEAQRQEIERKTEAERRLRHELEIARQVQARLFPQVFPPCESLEYAGICAQARQVGGDYYDYLDLGNGRIGLVIADIAGKGIAAALLMSNLQAHLRSLCGVAGEEPHRMLRCVNKLFFEHTAPSAYATLFFGEYDDRTRRLRYINCGHLSGLVLRGERGVERLESTSTVLGLFAQWDCTSGETQLERGDLLALYTDGVTETETHAGVEFGEAGLIDSLRQTGGKGPREIVDAVFRDVQSAGGDEQHDDLTMIAAICRG